MDKMRKCQSDALDRARRYGLPEPYIKHLEEACYPSTAYSPVVHYFRKCAEHGVPEVDALSRLFWYFHTIPGKFYKAMFDLVLNLWVKHPEVSELDGKAGLLCRFSRCSLGALYVIIRDGLLDEGGIRELVSWWEVIYLTDERDVCAVSRVCRDLLRSGYYIGEISDLVGMAMEEGFHGPDIEDKVQDMLSDVRMESFAQWMDAFPDIMRRDGGWMTYVDEDFKKKAGRCMDFLGVSHSVFTVDKDQWFYASGHWLQDDSLVFHFRRGRSVSYGSNGWRLENRSGNRELQVRISVKGKFVRKISTRGGNKLVPLKVKDLAGFYTPGDREFRRFLDVLCEVLGTPAAKDARAYVESGLFLPDLTVAELEESASLAHALSLKYPGVVANWGKHDVNTLYACHKVSRCADEKSEALLCSFREPGFCQKAGITQDMSFRGRKSAGTVQFIVGWYRIRMGGEPGLDADIIRDYVNMCALTKTPVNFRFRSWRKLEDEHDRLAIQVREKHTPKVEVPKKSVFHGLRKILPEEFEWIRSRKRLIQESVWQHNCVSSYAERINGDRCAIYSVIFGDVRYTLEFFAERDGGYVLQQVQGSCNRADSEEIAKLREYVAGILAGRDVEGV